MRFEMVAKDEPPKDPERPHAYDIHDEKHKPGAGDIDPKDTSKPAPEHLF